MKFLFSAGGLVYKNEPLQFLLIRAKNLKGESVWQLPKGGIEKGEKPEETAVREIQEETGIASEPIQRLEEIQYFFKKDNEFFKKKVYFLLMKYLSGEIKAQESEVEEASWFSPEEALKKIGYKNEVKILEKAISIINNG